MPRRSPRARRLQDLKRVLGVPPCEKVVEEASQAEENQQEEPVEERAWPQNLEAAVRVPTARPGEPMKGAVAEEGWSRRRAGQQRPWCTPSGRSPS